MLVRTVELFVPLAGLVDVEEEVRKIEAELEHQRGFLASVRKNSATRALLPMRLRKSSLSNARRRPIAFLRLKATKRLWLH